MSTNFRSWARRSALAATAVAAAVLVAACGGGGDGNQASRVTFTRMVNFGDSLSDVGSYKVGTVAAVGGGKYTVNGPDAKNWTELIAAQLGVPAPCAAVTGLDGQAQFGFSVPTAQVSNCSSYAQGGSRVTLQPGPGNKLLGGGNAVLGQLTIPVRDQIANHLSRNGGRFSGTEIVTVMAGGNDIFIQAGSLPQAIAARVQAGMPLAQAQTEAVTAAAVAMGTAGGELAAYVRQLIVANGARYVVVVNLPAVETTPFALAQDAASRGIVRTLVNTFNGELAKGLQGAAVVQVDAYTQSLDQAANPANYGLSNVTTPACAPNSPNNPLGGSSLTCTSRSVIAGDISRYNYADDVHPTPYGYQLLAQFVSRSLAQAGWL